MPKINQNYSKLPGSYLFSDIAKRVDRYKSEHPGNSVISLGIGDVTLPIVPAVTAAMHRATDEMEMPPPFADTAPSRATSFCVRRWHSSSIFPAARPSALTRFL